MRALKRLPAENWFVSVSRSDGSIAPYSLAASLQHILRQPSPPAAITNGNVNLSIAGAVKDLEGFEGLKILIVDVSGIKGKRTTSWIDTLAKARVTAYIVDGGKLQEVCYEAFWGYSRGPSPQGCDFLNKRVRFEQDGILHEVKLVDAVTDALRKGRWQYGESSDPILTSLPVHGVAGNSFSGQSIEDH